MKFDKKDVIVARSYKTVYKVEDKVIKVFDKKHPKADVFNEALNQARVEETGLNVPKVTEVSEVNGQWAIATEFVEGKTLADIMVADKKNAEKYMDQFVDLQLEIHSKKAPLLNKLKDKLARQINGLTDIDATTRYELLTKLEGMPKHAKVCHGDFNPSNVIIDKNGKFAIIDWAHATQGNASADAAMTYLLFALENEELAKMYMNLFCKKSDTAKQYVDKWLPIVAAAELAKGKKEEKEFLLKWIDVVEYE
ncbi:MAG: aminoglycoside phosphotransferase family protein [Lachnospiraceae bacterium]|nr:aminoglycoside phosphotransferase family protein [Lachnospiraceae bacterium]